jgi:hypothetical protein
MIEHNEGARGVLPTLLQSASNVWAIPTAWLESLLKARGRDRLFALLLWNRFGNERETGRAWHGTATFGKVFWRGVVRT